MEGLKGTGAHRGRQLRVGVRLNDMICRRRGMMCGLGSNWCRDLRLWCCLLIYERAINLHLKQESQGSKIPFFFYLVQTCLFPKGSQGIVQFLIVYNLLSLL